jgi:hypothetical protein
LSADHAPALVCFGAAGAFGADCGVIFAPSSFFSARLSSSRSSTWIRMDSYPAVSDATSLASASIVALASSACACQYSALSIACAAVS